MWILLEGRIWQEVSYGQSVLEVKILEPLWEFVEKVGFNGDDRAMHLRPSRNP